MDLMVSTPQLKKSAPLPFVGKIWKYLSSNKDLRWQREVENRNNFMAAVDQENKMIVGAMNRIVKRDLESGLRVKKLVAQASGNTTGTTLPDGELEQFTERDAEIDEAKLSYTSPENLIETLKDIETSFEQRLADRKKELAKENLESVNRAYEELAKDSPDLVKELRDVRRKITEMVEELQELS